jgi:nuclear pore complex protein Nup205
MALKRGCLDVILKLALSPLTSGIVIPELRAMEFLAATSRNQILALANPLWDQNALQDPALLIDSSALAVRDFLHVRDDFCEYAALELRSATESRAFSVQEKVVSTLLGSIKFPNGDQEETNSVFDLFDMFDMETSTPSDAACKYFKDIDLSICLKDDPETVTSFDVGMAEQNLILRKRELFSAGTIKETYEEIQVDDEIRAILASLTSMNNWRTIQEARISTLESWTDLMSLLAAQESVEGSNVAAIALQGLQVVLLRLEKTLSDDLDSAALLAKLTLTLVPAASSDGSSQRAGLAHERLVTAVRVSLKGITDSGGALALRDVCYRICCAVLASLPLTIEKEKPSPSPIARQLLQLIQSSGDRLITVITEDAFSGRGMTRVSSLLFLDALVALFQISNLTTAILRALAKLNFVPVLIDQSIGSIASSFQGDNGELLTAVAYFHTAMSLLLRICQTADGTQLVLNSGFFAATADSKLFSTDPDIGLDIDNPVALREFYKLLSAVLRVVTAAVIARGPGNATVLQQAKSFLQQNRFSMQAVFKRTSEVKKTAGPPEKEALDVADEFSKLLLVTGFLEVGSPHQGNESLTTSILMQSQNDEPAHIRAARVNGFT